MFQLKEMMSILVKVLLILFLVPMSWAAEDSKQELQEVETLQLIRGKSMVLKQTEPTKRISIADPEIADFVLISPTEIYITGKAMGTTNLTLWKDKSRYQIYHLEVLLDISQLKKRVNEILPQETDLAITATNDSLTLSGRVTSVANLNQVLTLARAFAPEGKINNLVEVRGVQQVMLEVRVAEMQRSLNRRLGINFSYVTGAGNFGISRLAGLTDLVGTDDANLWTAVPTDGGYPGVMAPYAMLVSPAVNALFRFNAGNANWTGFIDALKSDGLIKVLAEPTLIALSGQDANFLAGGEFPVPVPQGLGTVAIEYKPFGVGLTFTPTVLSDNKINIKVAPEVSELDFTNAIQFSGFVVPGLNTRKAQTVVELADGQSFAIAGLLKDTARDAMDKIPLLGDLPVLGALFRSRAFQNSETELVIIVTPHLVKPLDMAKQSLPTDYYTEPNDLDFYILGRMEGDNQRTSAGTNGELDGDFGHALPGKE